MLTTKIRMFGRFPLSSSPLHLLFPLISQCTVPSELKQAYFLAKSVGTASSHASVDHLLGLCDATLSFLR